MLLLLLGAALFLGGCASPSLLQGVPLPSGVQVFFATDRALEQGTGTFGNARGPATTLGTVLVSIPPTHRIGAIERPGWFRRLLGSQPTAGKDMLLLGGPQTLTPEQFYREIQNASAPSASERSAFIFVHGYNNSFEDAALRTAQLAVDLQIRSVPVFYSWPSQARMLNYFTDSSNAEWSEPHFVAFLQEFSAKSTASNIYVIGHSMGTRIVAKGLTSLLKSKPELAGRFKEVLLAAPDIDAQIFKEQIAPKFVDLKTNVTIYASSNDKTLKLSKEANGFARLGDAGSELVVLTGIETIDASAIETDWLSHGYFAQSRPLLTDLTLLLRNSMRAGSRPSLRPMTREGLAYWSFAP